MDTLRKGPSVTSTHKIGPNQWVTTLLDAGDGTGDAVLEIPREVVEQWGLKEGDVVELTPGDGEFLITKKDA